MLTHGDSDHLGFAERLRREHGVPVYVHEADAARARGEESTKPAWGAHAARPDAAVSRLHDRQGRAAHEVSSIRSTEVTDGQILDAPGQPRIISLPGHSPGSIAIHVPAVDAVFVGDALTTRNVLTGVRGPQPAPFTDDPAQAIDSLERLRATGAKWVLPGHGAPWSGGVDAAVDAVRAAATDRVDREQGRSRRLADSGRRGSRPRHHRRRRRPPVGSPSSYPAA